MKRRMRLRKGWVAAAIVFGGLGYLAHYIDKINTYDPGPHPIRSWVDVLAFGSSHPAYRSCFEKTTGRKWSDVRGFATVESKQPTRRSSRDVTGNENFPNKKMIDSNPMLGTPGRCKPAGDFEQFSHTRVLTPPTKAEFETNKETPLIFVNIKPTIFRMGYWVFAIGFVALLFLIGIPLGGLVLGLLAAKGSTSSTSPGGVYAGARRAQHDEDQFMKRPHSHEKTSDVAGYDAHGTRESHLPSSETDRHYE